MWADAYAEADIPALFPEGYRGLAALEAPAPLTRGERLIIVQQAIRLLGRYYVHLPAKALVYGVDPVGALTALLARLRAAEPGDGDPGAERAFHDELTAIFTSVRDRHTTYTLPGAYRRSIACLPFLVERCRDGHFVTRASAALGLEDFRELVDAEGRPRLEVLRWNGIPIARAVELNGEVNAGSNPEARLARGLERLSFRWLGLGTRPAEDWVVLTYRLRDDPAGRERNVRFPWLVVTRPDEDDARPLPGGRARSAATTRARDDEGAWIARVKRSLLAGEDPRWGGEDPVRFTRVHDIGYLRLFSFDGPEEAGDPAAAWLEAVRERLGDLTGIRALVIDVRSNPGGLIGAAEGLLQLLCAEPVTPQGLEFRNTADAGALAERFLADAPAGGPTGAAVREDARAVGAPYLPCPPVPRAVDPGAAAPLFQGPAVVVVDPLTYSAAEIFAAGFQDAGRGPVIGTGSRTGGGGANAWAYDLVMEYASSEALDPLPRGASFAVAIRRLVRVGPHAGLGLEDLGVKADAVHALTGADVLGSNDDLLGTAVGVLDAEGTARGAVSVSSADGGRTLEVDARGVDRVDVYLDGRPYDSRAVDGVALTRALRDGPPGPRTVLVQGFADGRRVAAHRWDARRWPDDPVEDGPIGR